MKRKQIWIAESLVTELEYARKNLQASSRSKKRVTTLEASEKLGKALNRIRNKGIL